MVLGILWIYWIGSILALVFGYVAKGQIDALGRPPERQGHGDRRHRPRAGSASASWRSFIVLALAFGDDVDDFDEINSDPSDGVCNEERFLEDPDC